MPQTPMRIMYSEACNCPCILLQPWNLRHVYAVVQWFCVCLCLIGCKQDAVVSIAHKCLRIFARKKKTKLKVSNHWKENRDTLGNPFPNSHEPTETNTAKISNRVVSSLPQLFRRVAAALPGMESMQETSKEGSILSVSSKQKQFNNSEQISVIRLLCCILLNIQ